MTTSWLMIEGSMAVIACGSRTLVSVCAGVRPIGQAGLALTLRQGVRRRSGPARR